MRAARLEPPMLTLTAAVVAVLAASGSVGAATPPPSPASGHAAVIAQANIEFTDGSYQWSVSDEVLDAGTPPSPAVEGSDAFFAVTAGALLAVDAGTPTALIAAGEAMFVRHDGTTTVMPTDGAAANFRRITLMSGGESGTGAPFSPGPGIRDVDVVRDVLDPGGTLAIPDSDAAPSLVIAVDGGLTVAGDPAGSADVTPAAPGTFDGNLTIVMAPTRCRAAPTPTTSRTVSRSSAGRTPSTTTPTMTGARTAVTTTP